MARDSASGFKPISPNPFIVGNPVRDPMMFFGREAEFDLVRKRFKEGAATGGLIVFSGERRSGKTSILFQIMNGRLGPEFIPVFIDMQSMAIEDETDFLGKIAGEILVSLPGDTAESVSPPEFRGGSRPSSAFRAFVIRILHAHPGRKLILLFDEYELFEKKIEAGLLTEDVIHILANLTQTESFFLVFTGSLNLEERKGEYARIFLQRSIFERITFLKEPAAISLITEPVRGRVEYDEGVVEAIYRLTAGQPFYTQAVCQNVVDQLNERQTTRPTREILDTVVDGIVTSPFPQMLFMWDGLERDEKLTLSLLAEVLSDETGFRRAADLAKLIAGKRYPLDLGAARLSTALANLVTKEMLEDDQNVSERGYRFRIDLWRLWIRRMHPVWQVIRELGIRVDRRKPRPWILWGGVAAVVLAAGWFLFGRGPGTQPAPEPMRRQLVTFTTVPAEALILRDGESEGSTGLFSGNLSPGTYDFRVTAPGYRDSVFRVEVVEGAESPLQNARIELHERVGNVIVSTVPEGARIRVDGIERGTAPLTVPGLAVIRDHTVEALLDGYQPAIGSFRPLPDTTIRVPSLVLGKVTAVVLFSSTPEGASVTSDGRFLGKTSFTRDGLSPGPQRFHVSLAGYLPVDTTYSVTQGSNSLYVVLQPEPPGRLRITGETMATIVVDDKIFVPDTYTITRDLPAGSHTIRVTRAGKPDLRVTIELKPGRLLEYDHTRERITQDNVPMNGS